MTRRTRTLQFLCGALAALAGVSAALAQTTESAPASAARPLPTIDPAKVRAYDLPGDDGAAIIVEWPRPKDDAGLTYVVEVAQSRDDLAAGQVKTVTVEVEKRVEVEKVVEKEKIVQKDAPRLTLAATVSTGFSTAGLTPPGQRGFYGRAHSRQFRGPIPTLLRSRP